MTKNTRLTAGDQGDDLTSALESRAMTLRSQSLIYDAAIMLLAAREVRDLTAALEDARRIATTALGHKSGDVDGGDPDAAPSHAPVVPAGERCRHDWGVGFANVVDAMVCLKCGKVKGKQGRKPAALGAVDGVTKIDPPLELLPLPAPEKSDAPPVAVVKTGEPFASVRPGK